MDNKNIHSILDICRYLQSEYNAIEITIDEFINLSNCVCEDIPDNIVKVYKIEDENVIQSLISKNEKEEILITIDHLEKNILSGSDYDICYSIYMNQISTGKLIVITLESDDNINLSGFTMQGSGEKLYNYLISLINDKIEKNYNPLDETISELNHYSPYGKYFK